MPPSTSFALLLAIAWAALAAPAVRSQTAPQEERVAAAFMLALGRAPAADELQDWLESEALSVDAAMGRLQSELQSDPVAKRAMVLRALRDAFGRAPTATETEAGMALDAHYSGLAFRYLESLAQDRQLYEDVIRRAYTFVIHRDAYPEEIQYWMAEPVHTYILLVGCIEDWARRNQPGLMVTAGTPTVSVNSVFLTTLRLSPEIAAEARGAMGLAPPQAPGNHLIAPGAAGLATGGRVHFVAVGGADWEE